MRSGLIRRLALCGALALSAAPGAALAQVSTFAPVAAVNDRVITRYDIEQRARIMAAASDQGGGAPAQMLDQALQALVNDQIKIQAAKSAGVGPDDAAMAAGMEEIARQNGMGADAMLSFFQARGVSREALQDQIRAEISWRNLLRGRYASRIEPSDREIAAAVAANPGADAAAVRARLIDQRAAEVSRAVLEELRAKAVIEQR